MDFTKAPKFAFTEFLKFFLHENKSTQNFCKKSQIRPNFTFGLKSQAILRKFFYNPLLLIPSRTEIEYCKANAKLTKTLNVSGRLNYESSDDKS